MRVRLAALRQASRVFGGTLLPPPRLALPAIGRLAMPPLRRLALPVGLLAYLRPRLRPPPDRPARDAAPLLPGPDFLAAIDISSFIN